MKVRELLWGTLCALALTTAFAACSDSKDNPIDEEVEIVLPKRKAYILNEGVYNSNNASISFYAPNKDAKDSENNFISNLYFKQNNKNLGDTAQDMIEHDGKLYVILSGSKIMVKLDAEGKEEATLSFSAADGDPRYMTAKNGKIYVTLYSGKVARIDAASLNIEAYVNVGSNPENIVELNGKLYVANSGWGAGTTVSVIDITTFAHQEDIDVDLNPYSLLKSNNEIFLLSWGNSWGEPQVPYSFQRIKSDGSVESIAVATHFAEHNGIVYLINSEVTDWNTHAGTNKFFSYNAKTHALNTGTFIYDIPKGLGTTQLRGISIDSTNGDIYLYTYGSGVTNGDIYRFKNDGSFMETFDCGGVFPNKIVFM